MCVSGGVPVTGELTMPTKPMLGEALASGAVSSGAAGMSERTSNGGAFAAM